MSRVFFGPILLTFAKHSMALNGGAGAERLMKLPRFVLFVLIASLSSPPVMAATFNESAEIEQIAHDIIASNVAVACQIRTSAWRKAVLLGNVAAAQLGATSEHPDASDNEIGAATAQMVKAAEVKAALSSQFAAPTKAECDILGKSHDLQQMDAAAKLGVLVGVLDSK